MTSRFRFGSFVLDLTERRLLHGDAVLDLNARYLDALALMVREPGRLITKERFLEEVWKGVPVTDEALTQCIKTLRRRLGDDAAAPQFIETAPKHGYRFIAIVETEDVAAAAPGLRMSWPEVLALGVAGATGGALAGVLGGVFYSFFMAPSGAGATSALLVLVSMTAVIGFLGGAGVAFGIAVARRLSVRSLLANVLGGAGGGFLVGAFVKLVGLDAFNLVFARALDEITGGPEGALLGALVGLGLWAAERNRAGSLARRVAPAALGGAVAGLAISACGGRLMAGSLALLAERFPESRLRLDAIAGLFGEPAFGPVSRFATSTLEGFLFAAFVVGAMIVASRRVSPRS